MNDMMKQKPFRNSSRDNIAIGFVVGWMLGALIDTFTGDTGIATIAGMFLGTILGGRSQAGKYRMEYPRGIVRLLVLWGVIFMLVLLTCTLLISNEITKIPQIVLVFIPVLPGLFFILTIGKAIASLNEVQRRIQMEAIAIGFAITALLVLTYGLLGMVREIQLNGIYVVLVMIFGWFIGKIWTRRKYRLETN